MARFPPGTGGGKGVADGRQGHGLLIHRPTAAAGLPLAMRTPPAHGDARAHVIPRRDALQVRPGKRGRPRQQFKGLAAEQGYDAKALRQRLRTRGIGPQSPTRVGKHSKPCGRPSTKDVPRVQAERTLAWFQRQYRRLVGRWARLAACFNAFLAIAMIQNLLLKQQ